MALGSVRPASGSRRASGPLPIQIAQERRSWTLGPRSIAPAVEAALTERLLRHARARWSASCLRVIVRARGEFAYVYAQARGGGGHQHLCRLRSTGDAGRWELALYRPASQSYVLFEGPEGAGPCVTPELAFDLGARGRLEPPPPSTQTPTVTP